MKNKILLICITLLFKPVLGPAQCTAPSVAIGGANIFPTSATIAVFCNGGNGCLGSTLYIEYGLPGFTPGTGSAAGPGGTVMSATGTNGTVQFNVTGLLPVTAYQIYARRNCSGSWSANNTVTNFITAFNCNNASIVTCNNFNTAVLGSGSGAWITCNNGGPDVIYSFTPSVSGTHKLFVKPLPITGCNFSYKASSLGCNSNGWNCLGYGSPGGITQFSFGPLTAGTPYYIKVQQNNLQALNVEFRVECPGCTNTLSNITITGITPYQATISWAGGAAWLEYGPGNFIPGTGTTPGGGTLLYGSVGTVTIYNLTPNTGYSYYLRPACNGLVGPNTNRQVFGTPACPAVQTYGALGSTSYAAPNSPGLFHYPGFNCQFYFAPGNETYYLFTPPATSKYEVSVFYNYPFGDYLLNYNLASGTCDPTNYLCPVITSGFPPNGLVTYEIGPLTGGLSYYLYFDFSDTVFDPSNILSFQVNCLSPQATITPSGSTTICNGNQVTLSAPAGSGNSYLWSNGKTNQTITTGTAGNYTVTLSNTCGTATSSPVSVTVNPTPAPAITAAGPTTFCIGGNVQLNTSSGGTTYQWKKNGVVIPGATTSSYTATGSGNYKVVKTNSYGCSGTSAATTITVYNNPSAVISAQGPTTFCAGDSVLLKTSFNSNYSYQWKRNNVNVNGATGNKIQAKTQGTYKLKVTNANSCTKLSNSIFVSVPCRTENSVSDGEGYVEVDVYPNPSSDQFHLKLNDRNTTIIQIRLTDLFGRIVWEEKLVRSQEVFAFGKTLPPGIYFASINHSSQKIKLIKTR